MYHGSFSQQYFFPALQEVILCRTPNLFSSILEVLQLSLFVPLVYAPSNSLVAGNDTHTAFSDGSFFLAFVLEV